MRRLIPFLLLLCSAAAWGAACESTTHVCTVRPSSAGTADGSDWNNPKALTGLTPQCGNSYLITGETYTWSASIAITAVCTAGNEAKIYKTVAGGPGSPDSLAGWNTSWGTTEMLFQQTQDNDPQAVYAPFFSVTGSYIWIDGVTPTTGTPCYPSGPNKPCAQNYGFHFKSNNYVKNGFISNTGSHNQFQHIQFDGIGGYNGYQVISCSRTTNEVTVVLGSTPRLVIGDHVDIYGVTPASFVPTTTAGAGVIDSVSGTTITYPQTGADETCVVGASGLLVGDYSPEFSISTATGGSLTASDNWSHDVPGGFLFVNVCDSCTSRRNYIARNHSTPLQHTNDFDGPFLSNSDIGQNIIEDPTGTTPMVVVGGGTPVWTNVTVWSNLLFCTVASQTSLAWVGPTCNVSTLVSDDNGANKVVNYQVFGNTFVRNPNCKVTVTNAGSSKTIENNLFYCPLTPVSDTSGITGMNGCNTASCLKNYNTGYAVSISGNGTPSTNDDFQKATALTGAIFTDPSDAAQNFAPVSASLSPTPDTVCSAGTNCLADIASIPAIYQFDLYGAPSTNRGAIAFSAGGGSSTVTVSCVGTANGTIKEPSPAGTNISAVCTAGVPSGTTSHSYTNGTSITIVAAATSGSFLGWSGACGGTGSCALTVNSPLGTTANFSAAAPTCSLTFASNSLNAPSLASATTVLTGVSGPGSLWFIFGPPPDNASIFNCQYPFSGCNANGQTGNIVPVGSGLYTTGACSNGVCCTGSTAPLNINTGAGSAAH